MSAEGKLHSPYTPRAELVAMFDGDAEFVDALAALFNAHCLAALNDIHEALDAGNGACVSRAAHALKGTVGYFDPGTGHAMVEAIERNPSDELARLPSLIGALELRLDRLRHHLALEFSESQRPPYAVQTR